MTSLYELWRCYLQTTFISISSKMFCSSTDDKRRVLLVKGIIMTQISIEAPSKLPRWGAIHLGIKISARWSCHMSIELQMEHACTIRTAACCCRLHATCTKPLSHYSANFVVLSKNTKYFRLQSVAQTLIFIQLINFQTTQRHTAISLSKEIHRV